MSGSTADARTPVFAGEIQVFRQLLADWTGFYITKLMICQSIISFVTIGQRKG
jgi:hypothetical protein